MTTGSFEHILIGGRAILVASFAVEDPVTDVETATNPDSVTFYAKHPSGPLATYTWPNPASPEIKHLATGIFTCTIDADEAGRWRCRVESTGACKAAAEGAFDVDESDVL